MKITNNLKIMIMKYFNIKTQYGVETIDHIDKKDFETVKDYRKEYQNILHNARLIYPGVYVSNRCTKEYRNKQSKY